jgi:phospholipase/carboxylesterase
MKRSELDKEAHGEYVEARLRARPREVTESLKPGQHALQLDGSGHDALLYVPRGQSMESPAPLAVMLHGAGGEAAGGLGLLRAFADEAGLILLAPGSQQYTWDLIASEYGPDVRLIDLALAQTFAGCVVDKERIAIGGFSDGASYALSLGLTNGDLFTHVLAFSPGFLAPASTTGKPRIFISHGTQDRVLPVERCSRRIFPQLERAGYETRYEEFDGPHTVPREIALEGVRWLKGEQK